MDPDKQRQELINRLRKKVEHLEFILRKKPYVPTNIPQRVRIKNRFDRAMEKYKNLRY